MTTARDLAIVALEVARDRSLEQGDLSLALAGAELLDLIDAGAIALDDDRIVPGPQAATGDRLLDEATASLVRQEPYETVEDWLWRRGSELAAAYVDDLEKIGLTTRRRGGRLPLLSGRTVPVDSPARSGAEERRASGEPSTRMCVPRVTRYGAPPGSTEAGAGITRSRGVGAARGADEALVVKAPAAVTSSRVPSSRVSRGVVLWCRR